MDYLQRRVERVAESILENESLTADLDDAAAKELLDWGIVCVERIARSTAGMDEDQAEDAMYQRLQATRRLMRGVNKMVARHQQLNEGRSAKLIERILEQAAVVYGPDFSPPRGYRRFSLGRLWIRHRDDPTEMVAKLRMLLE
jgi:hypothetical protein